MKKKLISFVIPIYCSEYILPDLYKEIRKLVEENSLSYELIFVDDCSSDNSWSYIKDIACSDNNVRGFRTSRNFGQHNATLCGIRNAKGEVIVTMDDDLQHLPFEVTTLLSMLGNKYDVVYGLPKNNPQSLIRNFFSTLTKFLLEDFFGASNARNISSFRVFYSKLRDSFSEYNNPIVHIDVLLSYATNRFTSVEVKFGKRKYGRSGYNLYRLIKHTFNVVTGFSTKLLYLSIIIGLTFSIFGGLSFIYVLINWILNGSAVPGFAFLASIISIFSGSQLLAIGIIGAYLARIHMSYLGKPSYTIREII